MKEPTEVQFVFKMEDSENESLFIEDSFIKISSFTFDGMRQAGDDVYFKIDYPEGLEIDISNALFIDELRFDIPQGIYDDLEITFTLANDTEDAAFFLNGNYEGEDNQGDDDIEFYYNDNTPYIINIHAISENGSSQIILDKAMNSEAEIILDPNVIFSTITENDWEDVNEEDNEVFISDDGENTALYSEMSSQIPHAFSLIVR